MALPYYLLQAARQRLTAITAQIPADTLDLQFDRDENLWVALMFQGGIAKFDKKTEKFSVFPLSFWAGSNHGASVIKLEPLD